MKANIGFILLVHANPHRAAGLIRCLTEQGAVIALHIDKKMRPLERVQLEAQIEGISGLIRVPSQAISWGQWSIVETTIECAKRLIAEFPNLDYIYNISGACVPLRPLDELRKFLGRNDGMVDHIESVTISDRQWVIDGLERERLELYHVFDWKKNRAWFDRSVAWQKRLKIRRRLPSGLPNAFGSQWWCLRKETLKAIFNDPKFNEYVRFYRLSWIPDESFFQSLARKHSQKIRSESLTFAKFDHFGSPFIFHDDQIADLVQLNSFFVRKVWPGANGIYERFVGENRQYETVKIGTRRELTAKLDDVQLQATSDRTGLVSQFTRPTRHFSEFRARRRYHAFVGFVQFQRQIFDFYQESDTITPYGSIFHPSKVELKANKGGRPRLADEDLALRDYAPDQYLQQLIWYNQNSEIAFTSKPHWLKPVAKHIASDPNANIVVLLGAWLFELEARDFQSSERMVNNVRVHVKRENQLLTVLEHKDIKATVSYVTIGEWLARQGRANAALPGGFGSQYTKFNTKKVVRLAQRLANEGISLRHYQLDRLTEPNSEIPIAIAKFDV